MNQTEEKKQQKKARTFIQLVESNKQTMYKIARSYLLNDEDIADAIQDTIESCCCITARDLRSVRSHSFSIWKKTL